MEIYAQALGNPQVTTHAVARVSAALPAAGAWDATPIELFCAGMESVVFYLTYTRGAVGGDVQFRIEASGYSQASLVPAGQSEWCRATVFSAGGVVSGVDALSNIQRGEVEYGSTAAAAEAFMYGPLELGQCVERIRLVAAESGVVGTPGTLGVFALFSPA